TRAGLRREIFRQPMPTARRRAERSRKAAFWPSHGLRRRQARSDLAPSASDRARTPHRVQPPARAARPPPVFLQPFLPRFPQKRRRSWCRQQRGPNREAEGPAIRRWRLLLHALECLLEARKCSFVVVRAHATK